MSFLEQRLQIRKDKGRYRSLCSRGTGIDLYSNDYLSFAELGHKTDLYGLSVGSTGSRLVSGNYKIHAETEAIIADFHKAEAALLFSSGYAANVGLFSAMACDEVKFFYDEFSHASIRDGIALSKAPSQAYRHGDCKHLEKRLKSHSGSQCIVVTESVDSMSGKVLPLSDIASICQQYGAWLIVDEAHSAGIFGKCGEGSVHELNLQSFVFGRVITYGKAFGCFGASVLGSTVLKEYLINFARSFVYSTALPPTNVSAIRNAYSSMKTSGQGARRQLSEVREYFYKKAWSSSFMSRIGLSPSPIQTFRFDLPRLIKIERELAAQSVYTKVMLSPTVRQGSERLRITLHAHNTQRDLDLLFAVTEDCL